MLTKSRVSDLDHHGNLFKRGDRSDGKVKRTDDSPPCQRTFRQFELTRTLKNITDESVPKVTFTRKLYLSPIGEDEHDPRVELRQGLGNEVLAGLGEDGADEPQVEGVGGETAF